MNEYIFFDAGLREQFAGYVREQGVVCELLDDNMGLVVAVPDDLSDDLLDALEAHYDELQDEQSRMLTATEGGFSSLAGFSVVLPDGQTSMVAMQPEMANRLLACFSIEEIQVLFSTVARSVLEPKDSHLCHILRADKQAKK
jgi:hypothetical protein